MALPREASFCDINHPPIAFLGDQCPLCTWRRLRPDPPLPRVDGHIWPHTWQLQLVLAQQAPARDQELERERMRRATGTPHVDL